jgi:hypothetical protein
MVITSVALLGLLKSLEVAMEHNVRNSARDMAMKIAEDQMRDFRTMDYDALPKPADYSDPYVNESSVTSQLKGINVPFNVETTVRKIAADSDALLVTVNVKWTYKNEEIAQGLQTVRSR